MQAVAISAQAIDAPVDPFALPEYIAFDREDRALGCAYFAERGQSKVSELQLARLEHKEAVAILRAIIQGRAVVHLSPTKFRSIGYGFVVDSLDPADGGPVFLPHKPDTPFQFIQQRASEQN